jgi:hypothetical protein
MSKIEVNTIEPQCGTTLTVGKCTTSVAVPGNVVKSNALQASDAGNIISQSGTTVTLGASGDTIALASGASQTGFGRTGTVDWDTTPKTATFTAVSGNGYFANTTGGAFNLTLPASPSAGDIVSVKDYAYTFAASNLTVDRNGSKIGGGDEENPVYATNGTVLTFIYVDGTQGWLVINESTNTSTGTTPAYVAACGGNTTITCGDYKTHIFTGPGTFTVSCIGNSAGSDTTDYLVVAGGGGSASGAGGAGGFRASNSAESALPAPSMSPLVAATGLAVTASPYPISVGGGGPSGYTSPSNGSPSIYSSITSTGGGHGMQNDVTTQAGSGGSGGGGGRTSSTTSPGGTGNTPPVSPSQGNNGGTSSSAAPYNGGGGGGAGAVGTSSPGSTHSPGGVGSFIGDSFFGPTAPSYGTPGPASPQVRYFAGGGAGGSGSGQAAGGAGGGGTGNCGPGTGTAGTINTGGGSGGGSGTSDGLAGGSGIVIIRYKFQ